MLLSGWGWWGGGGVHYEFSDIESNTLMHCCEIRALWVVLRRVCLESGMVCLVFAMECDGRKGGVNGSVDCVEKLSFPSRLQNFLSLSQALW